jgi:hypothetical protein
MRAVRETKSIYVCADDFFRAAASKSSKPSRTSNRRARPRRCKFGFTEPLCGRSFSMAWKSDRDVFPFRGLGVQSDWTWFFHGVGAGAGQAGLVARFAIRSLGRRLVEQLQQEKQQQPHVAHSLADCDLKPVPGGSCRAVPGVDRYAQHSVHDEARGGKMQAMLPVTLLHWAATLPAR